MLTSSLLHPKSEPLETKIAPSSTTVTASSPSVANRGAHKTVAGLVFGAQNGQQCLHAYMLTCSHAYMTTCLHAYMPTCLHAYMLTGTTGQPEPYWAAKSPLPPCIHASMHPCIHASMHPCTQSCMHRHMYTAAWFAVCYGWRVGYVEFNCH